MLPGIMSEISASASQAKAKKQSGVDLSDGIDLNDIMGMLAGAMNKAPSKKSTLDGTELISMLAGMM